MAAQTEPEPIRFSGKSGPKSQGKRRAGSADMSLLRTGRSNSAETLPNTLPTAARIQSAPPGGYQSNWRRQRSKLERAWNIKPTDHELDSKVARRLRVERQLIEIGVQPKITQKYLSEHEDPDLDEAISELTAPTETEEEKKAAEEQQQAKHKAGVETLVKNVHQLVKLSRQNTPRSDTTAKPTPSAEDASADDAKAAPSSHGSASDNESGSDAIVDVKKLQDQVKVDQALIDALIKANASPQVIKQYLPKLLPALQRVQSGFSLDGTTADAKADAKAGRDAKTRTCGICFDEKGLDHFVDANCRHYFCTDCWSQYLVYQIKNGLVADLKCPEPKCQRRVTVAEIKSAVNGEAFEKYERFLLNIKIAMDPNKRFCFTADCDGILTKQPMSNKSVCPKCRSAMCWACGSRYHSCTSCDKAVVDSKEGAYVAYKILHNVKKCPRCQADSEKMSGCNHMTCYNCRYQWCWICGGKYTNSHFAPWNIFGCANMQEGCLACLGDDSILCVRCNCLTCRCLCADEPCVFNPVGFTKRLIMRSLCFAGMIACGSCVIAMVCSDTDCCDDCDCMDECMDTCCPCCPD